MKKRKPLFIEVADKLEGMIPKDYPPGSKIPIEPELAEMFNVSRTTIRSAVSSLCSRNVLEIRRGDGTYVTENPGLPNDALGISFLDPNKVAEDIRAISEIIQPAAAGMGTKILSEESSLEIKNAIDALETEWELYQNGKSDYQQLRKCDTDFHSAVIRSSTNYIMDRIDSSLKDFSEKKRENRNIKIVEDSLEMHPLIYQAMLSGDADKAEELMREHILRIDKYLHPEK